MLSIPLQPVPSQTLQVTLDGQLCTVNVYETNFGLFVDLLVNDDVIIQGVLAENVNRIVRSLYLGFDGDLIFYDTQGSSDPDYTGLGGRFMLLYLEVSDLGGAG
jgi:hypothetical protein